MDLAAILKILKDNPEMLDKILPVLIPIIEKAIGDGIKQLVDGILAKV